MPKLASCGGCVAFRTADYLNGSVLEHVGHKWRRPTLAMMSPPLSADGLDLTHIPRIFKSYFTNDLEGKHLPELLEMAQDTILLTDFQRDVVTGVLEIKPGHYIMDPMDAINLIDDLTADTMTRALLDAAIGRPNRKICPLNDWEEFFPIWQREITRFLDIVCAAFDHVIITEQFQTRQRMDRTAHFHDSRIDLGNERLVAMYDFVRARKDITLIKVDPADLHTGRTGGPFGGPTPVHYIDETFALWEVQLTAAINALTGNSFDRSRRIYDVAFKRAADHEAALETLLEKEARIAQLEAQHTELSTSLSKAKHEPELRRIEFNAILEAKDILAEECRHAQSRIAELQTQLASFQSQLALCEKDREEQRATFTRLSAMLNNAKARVAVLEGSPWNRAKRTLARRTRKLRGL